jgi:hypothetical protein
MDGQCFYTFPVEVPGHSRYTVIMKRDNKTAKMPKVNIKSRSMLPKYTDEELTLLAQRIGLTLEQLKEFHEAVNRTYHAIGYDLQEARGGGDMKRAEFIEVVLDADHVLAYGELSPELKEWYSNRWKNVRFNLNYYYEAVAAGFPYPTYE